jgi:hypothetical protein
VLAPPLPTVDGVDYAQPLPAGFITEGDYSFLATGAAVSFQGVLALPSPIQVLAPSKAGTVIPRNQPLSVSWTGGVEDALVEVMLAAEEPTGFATANPYDYVIVSANAGSVSFGSSCEGGPLAQVCTSGLPAGVPAQVIVREFPASYIALSTEQGLTGAVNATWTYEFVFGGLTLE